MPSRTFFTFPSQAIAVAGSRSSLAHSYCEQTATAGGCSSETPFIIVVIGCKQHTLETVAALDGSVDGDNDDANDGSGGQDSAHY